MRIRGACTPCLIEKLPQKGGELYAELSGDCLLAFKCEHGHENVFVLQQQPFEILFEMSAMALLDGYFREAVGSAAVALERFLEFYIRIVCIGRGTSQETLGETWRRVAANSQQQLGAFTFLYLLETATVPPIPRWATELRNDVVHKGAFPTRDAAIKYSRWVFEFIRDTGDLIRDKYRAAADHVVVHSLVERGERNRQQGKTVGTQYIAMILTWAGGNWKAKTFDAELRDLAERRWMMWAPPGENEYAV